MSTKSIEQIKNLITKATKTAKSERDLSLKGLTFGRWWHDVGEYEQAAEWITKYLRVCDKDAKAHKLLGDIYEKLSKSDAALACYKNSLRVKPQQYELMLKVAEMHINPGPTQNPSRAQVWLDKAAVALPNNPQVYKLKMELFLAQEAPPSKLEGAILDELRKRPSDPSLYVQYVSFLKDQERLEEAFEYSERTANDLSLPSVIEKDFEWNQCLVDTCQEYAERMCDDEVSAEGIRAYSLLVISLCKYIWLCLEQGKYDDAIENLAILDTSVFSALSLPNEVPDGGSSEWQAVLSESKGQLYWLTAVILIYQATQNNMSWSEAIKLSATCFSVSLKFPIMETISTWASRSKDVSLPLRLRTMGGFRLSQCGHMLYNLAATSHSNHEEENNVNEQEWMDDVTYNYCTDEGRKKILQQLFSDNYNPDISMIYNFTDFTRTTVRLVAEEVLVEYDNNAVTELSLQTWVWIGMQWRRNFDNALDPFPWISAVFPELSLTTSSNVKYGNVWNLSRLDAESFIVACVLHAKKASLIWQGTKMSNNENALKQSCLPLPLSRKFVTEPQNNWWEAACKLHNSRNRERIFNSNQLKATLRHGIECIRGSANHGMQLMLIAGLAKHFAAKAYTIDKTGLGTASAPWLAYQRRAAQYWTMALPMLQDVIANRVKQQPEPKDRLFPRTLEDPTIQEARSMISEVYMCNGGLLVQEGELKKAIETYGRADTPHASFCEALIYKQLYENNLKDNSLPSGSATKRRETYYRKFHAQLEVTLNRLERTPDEELLTRTEAFLRPHDDVSVNNRSFEEEVTPKLFRDGTKPKQTHHHHVANHTVNSEVDESILANIPSKQSTPKSEMKSMDFMPTDKSAVVQLTQNLSALTSAVSTLQVQFDERINKVDISRKQEQEKSDTEKSSNVVMSEQLTALANIMSGLQLREERFNEQQKQVQQQMHTIQEQMLRLQTQFTASPATPNRVVHIGQAEGMVTPGSIQVFDQYQQGALAQVGSPAPGTPYYNVYQYPGYAAQNPAMAAVYNAQGYPVTPTGVPAYVHPRSAQAVIDSRGVPSPVNTPPAHMRATQQQASNAGLQMSKEAADALSQRFQATLSGSASPVPGMSQPVARGAQSLVGVPATGQLLAVGQSYSQPTSVAFPNHVQRPQPAFGGTQAFLPNQGSVTHAYSDPVIDNRQSFSSPATERRDVMTRQQPEHYEYKANSERDLQQAEYEFDESYLPPSTTNTARPDEQSGTSVLKSLLMSKQALDGTPPQSETKPVEINYPKHINFPTDEKSANAPTATSEWKFNFQSPEEMDKANMKLEADEEAEDAETAHNDTGPHFEPIVSLPEVEVITGEENEEEMFSERAKLYRWHEGEWKERGLGNMKIMKHEQTGKHRLLMRREQVLKICCNHIISSGMDLTAMQKTDRAWVWHAIDFSEEESKSERFAIRFKTPEIANEFRKKFMEGKDANAKLSGSTPVHSANKPPVQSSTSAPVLTPTTVTDGKDIKPAIKSSTSDPVVPKFKFAFPKPSAAALDLAAKIAGTPPRKDNEIKDAAGDEDNVVHNEGDGPHFEPIVQLPEKVDLKTGEEDEEVLFCHRAKLYRFTDKQWKERGVGDIKILQNKSTNKFRVVMRREQVLKLCANHYITSDLILSAHGNSDKAWTWTAMDHSDTDEQPQQELLAVRFKLSDTAAEFKKIFDDSKDITAGKAASKPSPSVQQQLTSTTSTGSGIFKMATFATDNKPSSFAFSSPTSESVQSQIVDSTSKGNLVVTKQEGEWQCPSCLSPNIATDLKCPCCDTPHPNAPKTEEKSVTSGFSFSTKASSGYSFGLPSSGSAASSTPTPSIFGLPKTTASSSAFVSPVVVSTTGPLIVTKQEGNWDCASCFTNNNSSDPVCPCCNEPNPNAPKETPKPFTSGFSFALPSAQSSGFSFGIPSSDGASAKTTSSSTSIFGLPQKTTVTTHATVAPPVLSNTGPLTATKQEGTWDCKSCYTTNAATDQSCPCCGESNPSAAPAVTKESTGYDLSSFSKGNYSFGIPAKPAPDSTTSPSIFGLPKSTPGGERATAKPASVISPPKFSFGMPSGTTDNKASFNFNNSSSGGPQKVSSIFSPALHSVGSGSVTSKDLPKPRFPSVGYDEDKEDESNDDDDQYGSSYDEEEYDSSSYDEEDQEVDSERFRSPLSRQQEPVVNGTRKEDDDVICMGEILPSPELQEKAEKLMLPKHFYNFLKDGEDASGNSEDDEDEAPPQEKTADVTKESNITAPEPISTSAGFGFSTGSTFADLAKNTSTGTGFSFGASTTGSWTGMTKQTPLFANVTNVADTSSDGNEYYQSEEKDEVHFEPVVQLPEKVEISTGEEDDDTIYSQRCKLFRWNKPTNEWKERGVGDIKLLRNKKTGRIRVLMRREQVLKVCANHYIRPGMNLDPNKTSDRALNWSAMDFTDDDPKMEMFTAKFKSTEIAMEFKEKFEECQTMLLDADPMTPCKASGMRTKELSDRAEKMKNELKFFKDKFSEPSKIDLENTLTDESALPESIPTPLVGSLTPLVAQHNQRRILAEQQPANETKQKPIDWNKKEVIDKQSVANGATSSTSSKENSAPSAKSVTSSQDDDHHDEPDIHFEPIVQLPEKVDLITGEEDEQILFGNRSKLYVFDIEGKQWKERGIGDVKIMQNLTSCKVRVIMRREQVLKVCLNHFILPEMDITYKENSGDKVLVWTANDFSDDEKREGEVHQFALRFKTSDRAECFKQVAEEGKEAAQGGTLLSPDLAAINTSLAGGGGGATSPGPTQGGQEAVSPQSPTSPVKPLSSFSFANIQSPIQSNSKTSSDSPVNVMGFMFGKTPDKSTVSTTPSGSKFKFDMSKMSFNFASSTSTPQCQVEDVSSSTNFFTPPTTKSGASKTLFTANLDTTSTNSTLDSNLFSTPNETFTKPDQQTLLAGDQSPALPSKTPSDGAQQSLFGGAAANAYKPSPLAMASDFQMTTGSAFSIQSTGAGSKFQFIPASTGLSQKETVAQESIEVSDDNDDVIFVSEITPTEAQRKRAAALLLPPTFYLFEDKAPHPGFNEQEEEKREDKILQFIHDRDSGKITRQDEEQAPLVEITQFTEPASEAPKIPNQPDNDPAATQNKWVFGGDVQVGATSVDFSSMAATVQNVGFKKDPSFQFPGAGQVMFQDQTDQGTGEGQQDASNYKCEAQFKPVLEELPPLIEVKTGEEGEEVLFKERCKLYRYDAATVQWKERGVGEIKILYNDEHKLHRVVMRREQVLKVCANHVINEKTDPKPHLGSTKTCTYFAMDYSEGTEPQPEQFAIRFKNDELCQSFTDKITEVKALLPTE